MRSLRKSLLSLAIVGLVMPTFASADVVNIDFGPGNLFVGTAAAPDAAGATATWTGNTSGVASDLVTSTGAATLTGININRRGDFGAAVDQEVSVGAGITDLQADYLTSRANNSSNDLRTGQINGLIVGNSYDLYIYGQGDNHGNTGNNSGQNVGIRIGTDVRHTSWDGVDGGDGLLVEDIEYVLFSGLIADSNGEINFEHFNPGTGLHGTDSSFFDSSLFAANPADPLAIDADGDNSRFHAINGIQIVGTFAVPEPSSMTVLGLFALGTFTRRRKS